MYSKTHLKIAMWLGISCFVAVGGWAQQSAPEPSPAVPASPQKAPSAEAGGAVKPNDVVLTVGDTKITAAEFEDLLKGLPPTVARALPSIGKKGFAQRYANLLALVQEAKKRKLDQTDTFRRMEQFQRMMLLAQLTVNQLMGSVGAVSPDEVNYYYTAHKHDFEQVKLRGIYIPFKAKTASATGAPKAGAAAGSPSGGPKLSEAEAKAKAESLRERILAGENMADLAKKESVHPTAAKGGDFGYVRHRQFAPRVDNVIFSLDLNQVSVPVRDRFGYYLFRVEGKRTQPLDQVKPMIEAGLRRQKIGEALAKVQAAYPVTYNESYFSQPAPARPAAPVPPGLKPGGAAPAPPAPAPGK